MRFMEEALSSYKAPTADDLDIELPVRMNPREQRRETSPTLESRDLVQRGGSAEEAAATNDMRGDPGTTSATADPAPQRDEPDDGEHTDSTVQEVAERATRRGVNSAEDPQEGFVASTVPLETEPLSEAPEEAQPTGESLPAPDAKPKNMRQELSGITGIEPRAFQKTGFSSGGVETTVVKRFPSPLVDRLRLSLAPAVGGEFAEALSAPALITAFLMAKTGVELDVDANTAVAVDVFRQVDPRLLAVENKLDDVLSDFSALANAMNLGLKRIGETATIAEGLEFTSAYLIADRVAGLTTTDTNEANVDVTQKKAMVARESIRKRVKEQRTIERERDGRRMT